MYDMNANIQYPSNRMEYSGYCMESRALIPTNNNNENKNNKISIIEEALVDYTDYTIKY